MYDFDKPWAEEIAEVTGDAEYQTAVILLEDFSGVTFGDRDFATGEREQSGEPTVIYSGQARVIGIRAGKLTEGVEQSNSMTLVGVRFQVPHQAVGHVATGQALRVVSAPQNPTLERFAYKVNDDFQGSSAATRTFEAGVALDSAWVA